MRGGSYSVLMNIRAKRLVIAAVCIIGALVLLQVLRPSVAPMPAVFSPSIGLNEALRSSIEKSKPVLAFVTADWCGPCQRMKRDALADPDVQALMLARTIPVYVDATVSLPPEAESWRIMGYPTMVIVQSGRATARFSGVVDAKDLLAWIEANAPAQSSTQNDNESPR